MTRYVFKKKQGLVIGSGNIFFWFSTKPCTEIYRAVVWAQPYEFNEDNPHNGWLTHGIKTPAFQMIWEVIEKEIEVDFDGKMISRYATYHRPRHLIKSWLDENTPGYGLRPIDISNDPQPTVFFANRKHAVAFVRFIEESLKEMAFESF